jgi:hypothetical protein
MNVSLLGQPTMLAKVVQRNVPLRRRKLQTQRRGNMTVRSKLTFTRYDTAERDKIGFSFPIGTIRKQRPRDLKSQSALECQSPPKASARRRQRRACATRSKQRCRRGHVAARRPPPPRAHRCRAPSMWWSHPVESRMLLWPPRASGLTLRRSYAKARSRRMRARRGPTLVSYDFDARCVVPETTGGGAGGARGGASLPLTNSNRSLNSPTALKTELAHPRPCAGGGGESGRAQHRDQR